MRCNSKMDDEEFEKMHEHLKKHMAEMSGEDIRGIELSSTIKMLANLYDSVTIHRPVKSDISAARMGILIRLTVEEDNGNHNGLTPTMISRFQNVKKNTTSSLLRGLEEDGLIERTLDRVDKRIFFIRITEKGKKLVEDTGPARMRHLNLLSSGLTREERDQLLFLLEKLQKSILQNKNVLPDSAGKPLSDEILE